MKKIKVHSYYIVLLIIILKLINGYSANNSYNNENVSHQTTYTSSQQLKFNHTGDYYDHDSFNNQFIVNNQRGQRQKHNKHVLRLLNDISDPQSKIKGLYPPVFNVASKALITTNATCGTNRREEFCKITDNRFRPQNCGICDLNSPDPEKRHLIDYALDSTNRWWQSPSLYYGKEFEKVTVDVDLGQIYQIVFVMIKSANSLRPASWVLERSVDGEFFYPWQYFGTSDVDCQNRFQLPANNGRYQFKSDTEVICSTQFGKAMPLENGEIHVSLIHGRPGANTSSHSLINFTLARYIRLRLEGLHSGNLIENNVRHLISNQQQSSIDKQIFYSIRLIKIGGRCFCSGHADKCKNMNNSDKELLPDCKCLHNTCGKNCEKCCPLYNQRSYRLGNINEENICEKCQCYGHAKACRYSSEIEERGLSTNIYGEKIGGGVCIDCDKFTAGINCEKCIENYYRPFNVQPFDENPCIPCECDPVGSEGPCDTFGGQCNCKEGFIGQTCSMCDAGYRGEMCSKCLCDIRGTMPGGECESHCQCKLHVNGPACNKCSEGYFGLQQHNSEGCLKCYCSGVGSSCRSSNIEYRSYETLEDWKITDIAMSAFGYPIRDNRTGYMVYGMYELQDIESVYWMAPEIYIGNKLTSYGSILIAKVSWIVVRGDTSGKPTPGPDIILIGQNGIQIAFGDSIYKTSNTTISVHLTEDGWYHIPKTVKDIVTRLRRTEYRGDLVTRVQFMSVLSDLKSIMIRGTYHTDQAESILERVILQIGGNDVEYPDDSLVEECDCPQGYTGLSCENCDFGYTKLLVNSSSHELIGKCIPCNCNGHAETCDLESENCGECQHNTYGERCERCAVGYYGNALYGTEKDCIRCACPLLDDRNNFSPRCQIKFLNLVSSNHVDMGQTGNVSAEYICTQCPIGYTGDHCEVCDDGYYGSPTVIGSKCLPCPCNGGPCDPVTGNCITCLGNTEGWRCERCKSGYFGDPSIGCQECSCHEPGSIANICDIVSGHCVCKPKFTGRRCDNCDDGYANITLDCIPCDCNSNGTTENLICDPNTGQCHCKFGVEGLKCDSCAENFHGFSTEGCSVCNCNKYGSEHLVCNPYSGICKCLPNVVGEQCTKCKNGYWNIKSMKGCEKCTCSRDGSHDKNCNDYSGQCNCKAGVTGINCDQCTDDHYGFSSKGCKKCDVCASAEYICDRETGRCICPPKSKGPQCQQCFPNTYGWEYRKGCRDCECKRPGSIGQGCDTLTGQCTCREGFIGQNCDECASGYFGYPDCRKCNCDIRGSKSVDCDEKGQCSCKQNVRGKKCAKCLDTTFGLSHHNLEGCLPCFCFGRSNVCKSSDLSWGQVRMPYSRNLSIEYIKNFKENDDYNYVIVLQMEGSKTYREDAEIKEMNGLQLIPKSTGNVSIGISHPFNVPLYFQLPPQFLGDRINSYSGFLNFTLHSQGDNDMIDRKILEIFPLIQIHSHENYILDYYGPEMMDMALNKSFAIKFHERYWRYNLNGQNITRSIMLTGLQNIKHIFIRASTLKCLTQVVLSDVTLDSALYISGATNNVANQIESCDCDPKYSSGSCQDANVGHFIYRDFNTEKSDINSYEDFIGISIPCACNGRSNNCDKKTGKCLNCTDNTSGHMCNECAEGYFGNPVFGECKPCPCPETRKNFAKGCNVTNFEVSCICKPGYIGAQCDICDYGYFGNPEDENGKCDPCDCDSDGTVSSACDPISGQCTCYEGITGRRCDRCIESRKVVQFHHCQLCDNCTLILLDRVESLNHFIVNGTKHIMSIDVIAPWPKLNKTILFLNKLGNFKYEVDTYHDDIDSLNHKSVDEMSENAKNLEHGLNRLNNKFSKRKVEIDKRLQEANGFEGEVLFIKSDVEETISQLNEYGHHTTHYDIVNAVDEANKLYDDIVSKGDANKEIISNIKVILNKSKRVNKDALDISKAVNQQQENLEELLINLEDSDKKLNDLNNRANEVFKLTNETISYINSNNKSYEKLLEKYNHIRRLHSFIDEKRNISINIDIDSMLDQANQNLNGIHKLNDNIRSLNKTLSEKIRDNDSEYQKLNKILLPGSFDHSEDIIARSAAYTQLFQKSKFGAEDALRASNAHKNIILAINDARDAAEKAIEASQKSQVELKPNGVSVTETAEISLEKSDKIIKMAEKESENLKNLRTELRGHENTVNTIKNTIWQTGSKCNNISDALNNINVSKGDGAVINAIKTAETVTDEMEDLQKYAAEVSHDVIKLKEKLINLEPDWDTKYSMASENVSKTLGFIRESNNTLHKLHILYEKDAERFKQAEVNLPKKYQELRDKIARARHAAEGIGISVDSGEELCKRSYKPMSYGLKSSSIIRITIAMNHNIEDSQIAYIQGEDDRFMALEMVNRKIKFIWNLGGITGQVVHPVKIEHKNVTSYDAWYQIEAMRTMNVGSLNVKQMTLNATFKESKVITAASDSENTIFIISPNNRIWIGGVPEELQQPEFVRNSRLGLVVSQLDIDNRPIGLWNFITTDNNCKGAVVAPEERSTSEISRYFNGEGYSKITRKSHGPYKKGEFSINMYFKTLDENALLFLAVDEVNNRSLSLTLHEGRVLFRVVYSDDVILQISTTQKYNTGVWISLIAARHFEKKGTDTGQLKVNSETHDGSPNTPINLAMLPDLSNELFYIGGLPPGFQTNTTKAPGADHAFLGCMRDIQISSINADPLESKLSFGIETKCRETISRAGFYGSGYLELPSHTLRKGFFAFTFRTLQEDTLLLMSTCPPHAKSSFDAKEQHGDYAVAIIGGNVVVWVSTGLEKVILETKNKTYNDGKYHVINVNKYGKRVELRVDDILQSTQNFHKSPFIILMAEEDGGLYLGGLPDYPEYDLLVPTLNKLNGTIVDLVFNNRTITFEHKLNFTNVEMGRSGPPMGAYNGHDGPMGHRFQNSSEGCQKVGSYSYEPNAFKFGDGNRSYSIIDISKFKKFWHKDFSIEFDFRTFYPNGVLFITPGMRPKNKHYVSLVLKDGYLVLNFRDKRKAELKPTVRLNDGNWHHVIIKCTNRTTSINVDYMKGKLNTVQIKLPKRVQLANIISIGGLPENRSTLPKQIIMKLEELVFKGCIRRLSINNDTQDLARPDLHLNIGQCFPRVEKGSYFPGDAYALYNRNFDIGKHLEFQLEFKTSELNGILISVTESSGSPSLTLEMFNGNIIMSYDLNKGNPVSVKTNLPSKFALCNNKWHTISGLYDIGQIVLRVDNEPIIIVNTHDIIQNSIVTNAPFYIGGIPDNTPNGMLQSRENFKGCIKNFAIIDEANQIKDWTDMDDLHNVLLSECLAVK